MANKKKAGSKSKAKASSKPKPKPAGKAKQASAKKKLAAPKRAPKTGQVKAKVAVKKAAAKTKPARAPETPIATATLAAPKFARMAVADVAPAKPCLPLPAAIALVRKCFNAPGNLPLDTQLGVLIPDPASRNSCCQCVANGVPIGRSEIPCGSSDTLQDVVDAIAC
jgi:hypothetical protein